MLRLTCATALLALAVANPAFAQGKGNGNEGGKGKGGGDHAAMGHAPGGKGHGGGNGAGNGPGKGKDSGGKPDKAMRGIGDGPGKAMARTIERGNAPRVERVREARDKRRDDRVRMVERTVVRDHGGDWNDRRSDWDGRGDWNGRGREFASFDGCPPGLAKKGNGCLPPGQARQYRDDRFGYNYRPSLFGIPLRTRADYGYYNGYLVPVNGSSGLSYIPLLGGALGVGQMWPQEYPSLQLADWQQDYYGFDDRDEYRYVDNVVYQVDPQTSAIEAVVALLTGNNFNVGQQMPFGYDVYNVPAQYQDRYPDSDESLYRYADGRVYEIDPTTQLIQAAIDLVA